MVRSLDDPSLEDGVAQLRIQAYPQFPETHDVEFYSSVYRWFERHPLGNEMYRWVAVADDGQNGSRVVGHLAATPQYYRIGGQRVVAYTPCDYMVHYRHGFQAFHLMRMFFRTTENCVACDMVPAVIAVESRLGAEVAGQLQYAAKLLNVSRLPVPPVPSPVRRLLNLQQTVTARGYASRPDTERHDAEEHVAPPLVRPRAPIPAPVKKLLNEGLRIADEVLSSGFGDDLRAEVLEGFDESFDELFEKIAAQVPCVPEKDSAFSSDRTGREVRRDTPRLLRTHGEHDSGPRRQRARPHRTPGAPRCGAGATPGVGTFLQAGGGSDRQVQVCRVAHRASAERFATFGVFLSRREAPHPAGQFRGS